MNSKRKGQRPRHERIEHGRRNAKLGGAKGGRGNTAGQTKARVTRGPSRRSDSSTTDDGRARLLARVLSLDEGTPEREESMGELSRHLRRHQPMPFMATPERIQAEKAVVQAQRDQKTKAVYLLVDKLKDEGIELAERVELISGAIEPILLDTELTRWLLPTLSEALRKADPEGWRAYVEQFLRCGMSFAAARPDVDIGLTESVAGVLRGVVAAELGLTSAAELFLLDEFFSQWVTVVNLRRRAETAYRAGGKTAVKDYARLMELTEKFSQQLAVTTERLLAKGQSPVRMITVEEMEPPGLERDAPAAESV